MKESLVRLAEELDRQLKGGDPVVSAAERSLLEQLDRDIHAALAQPGTLEHAGKEDLVNRLRDATTRLEASHPTLTAVMAQVISGLTNIGV